MKIYIDDREHIKRQEAIKKYFPDICVTKRLDVGDIVITRSSQPNICIEVKTVQDYCSSIINRRLQKELLQMHDKYTYNFLLIYGKWSDIDYSFCKMSKKQRYSNMISAMQRYHVPCIIADNEKDFLTCIELIIRTVDKECEPIEKPIVRQKTSNPMENVLIGLPKCGPKTARKLLDAFGNVKNVFNASAEELDSIPRLSKDTKKAILLMGKV